MSKNVTFLSFSAFLNPMSQKNRRACVQVVCWAKTPGCPWLIDLYDWKRRALWHLSMKWQCNRKTYKSSWAFKSKSTWSSVVGFHIGRSKNSERAGPRLWSSYGKQETKKTIIRIIKIITIIWKVKECNLFGTLSVFESHEPKNVVEHVYKSFVEQIHLFGGRCW